MANFSLTVPGCPVPKQRARRAKNGTWYTPTRTKKYEEEVATIALSHNMRPATEPVRMTIDIYWPDKRRRDLDNACKSIGDALNGIAYEDDSQIAEIIMRAHLDRERPRAEVVIEIIEKN